MKERSKDRSGRKHANYTKMENNEEHAAAAKTQVAKELSSMSANDLVGLIVALRGYELELRKEVTTLRSQVTELEEKQNKRHQNVTKRTAKKHMVKEAPQEEKEEEEEEERDVAQAAATACAQPEEESCSSSSAAAATKGKKPKDGGGRRATRLMQYRAEKQKNAEAQAEPPIPVDLLQYNRDSFADEVPLRLLPKFVELCKQDSDKARLHGTLLIRLLLCVDKKKPIEEIVKSGVCPLLVKFLRRDDLPALQVEAAWALSNIVSGTTEQTPCIAEPELGAVSLFVRLLDSPSEDCRDHVCMAVGNIASESAAFRDTVLSHNVIEPLLRCVKTTCSENAVWALCMMCDHKPRPALDKVAPCLPIVAELLTHPNGGIVTGACWTIKCISRNDQQKGAIQAVLDAGVMESVIRLLASETVISPAIKTIRNVTFGSHEQKQVIIDLGAINYFRKLLAHECTSVRKDTCFAIANMCAGPHRQIQAVIDADLIQPIAKCMSEASEVKKEAVMAIVNIANDGSREQVRYLIDCGCVAKPLCDLLNTRGPNLLVVALAAVHKLLQLGEDDKMDKGEGDNEVAVLFKKLGAATKIETLRNHNNVEVSKQSVVIVDTFFPDKKHSKR